MKLFGISALALFFVTASFGQFEGVMEMKTTSSHGDGAMRTAHFSLSIKGNKLLADMKEMEGVRQPGKMIFRGDKGVMWIVDVPRKSYLEIDLKDSEQESQAENGGGAPEAKIRKTGKSAPILGYVCDEWVVKDGDVDVAIWGTPKLGGMYEDLYKVFGQVKGRGRGPEHEIGWEGDLARMKVFPLKIVQSQGGAVTETQEITRIDAKPLAASLFEVPAGYTKQEMGGGMQEMIDQLQKQGMQNGGKVNKEELEKMMKELQKSLKQQGGEADSSHDDDQR